ncbi:hypothetical protein [uncultured Halopseudomonas sp.]|uniref:hypothetical protein n=1 Tax=uncultured Halopseudomonas sp. TaxID=2901193 RepID=UPI0030EEF8C5|tara:strand:- start:184813 stop:185475 length:663 start_codon:yes stop_codon:yes gene_type:complete
MTSIVYLLLGASALGLCFWLWRHRADRREGARGAITAGLVALVMVAGSALPLAFVQWDLVGKSLEHAQRIMGLAAQHMSLPLLGLACLYLASGWRWQPIIWSRIILGILAFYELSRFLEWQTGYLWLLTLTGAVALAISGFLNIGRDRRVGILCLAAIACLLAPSLINGLTGQLPLLGLLDASSHASWLIPGFIAAGMAVGVLAEQAHNEDQKPPEHETS